MPAPGFGHEIRPQSLTTGAVLPSRSKFGTGFCLEPVVGTVAVGLAIVVFAAAQGVGLGLVYLELHWRKVRALVTAIAERLFRAFAAAAPKIIFALFQIGHVGKFLGDYRVRH